MPITVNENYRLKLLAKKVTSCESILDIGCAQQPNEYLNNKLVTGLDLNRAEMPDNYSFFYEGSLESIIEKNKTFDGIVAGEILEHLHNPIDFLKQCHHALKPGGILALSTPNPHSPIETFLNITLNKNYFYTKDHVMLFPQRWLIRMLEISGFSNVRLFSGGFPIPSVGLVPCPRFLCHQTIAIASKDN